MNKKTPPTSLTFPNQKLVCDLKKRILLCHASGQLGGMPWPMLPIDVYGQADVADPILDEQTVLNLARRHVSRCAAVNSVDETGGEARTYGISKPSQSKSQSKSNKG